MKPIKFYLDFDGTITTEDVVDKILNRFAPESWKAIEQEWVDGKIGSRECLKRQMDLVTADPEELDLLLHDVKVDPYFVTFLKAAREFSVPVVILSDGFDWVIKRLLNIHLHQEPSLLANLPVYCNTLAWTDTKAVVSFPRPACSHGCASCKESLIEELSGRLDQIIFVGDGHSDRYAAGVSDLVFAKEELYEYCREKEIPYLAYSSFKDVHKWLMRHVRRRVMARSR